MWLPCKPHSIYLAVDRQVVYAFYIIQAPSLLSGVDMVDPCALNVMAARKYIQKAERMQRGSVHVVMVMFCV